MADTYVLNGMTYSRGPDGQFHAAQSPVQMMGGITTKAPNTLDVQGKTLGNQKLQADVGYDVATQPGRIREQNAKATSAELAAKTAQETYNINHPAMDGQALSGPAYLAQLQKTDPGRAAYIKGLSEGRVPFPGAVMMKSPQGQALLMQVMRADPTIDATTYATRAAERKNAAVGKLSDSDTSMMTAIGHAQRLSTLVPEVFGSQVTPFNTIANAIDSKFGGGKQPAYDQNARLLGDETSGAYSANTGAERHLGAADFDSSLATGQKNDNIRGAIELMASKLAANRAKFAYGNNGLGKPDFMLLPPETRDALQKIAPDIAAKYFAGVPVMASTTMPPPPAPPGAGGTGGGNGTPPANPNGAPGTYRNDVSQAIAPAAGGSMHDAQQSAYIDSAIRAGVPYEKAYANIGGTPEGGDPAAEKQHYDTLVAFAKAHPDYQGSYADIQKPTSIFNKAINSAPGVAVTNAANTAAGGIPAALQGRQGQLGLAAANTAHPLAAGIGQTAGFIGGSYGLGRGLEALGATRGAPLAADLIQGYSNGATGNPDSPIEGGVMGATAALAGHGAGRVLGAGARTLAETAPGQTVINGAGGIANRVRGMFGGNPLPQFSPPSVDPNTVVVGRAINGASNGAADTARANLQDAARLGLPYSLADSLPQTQALGGTLVRKGGDDVLNFVKPLLNSRQAGQGERAIGMINSHLAPTDDITNLVENARSQATTAASPLYDQSYEVPARTSPQLEGLLNTPSGKGAIARARTIAADEQRDPNAMGFTLDGEGNSALTSSPSWQTLDYVKRGLDDRLAANRSANMGRLDEAGRATDGVRSAMLGQMDTLNPIYGQARGTYRDIIGQGNAAQQGYDATAAKVTPTQVGQTMAGLQPPSAVTGDPLNYTPNFQQGYGSKMADTIGNLRRGNPYEAVNGSPYQKQKLNMIFPDGASDFERAQQLEGNMADTNQRALGGSQTQFNNEADKAFAGSNLGGEAVDAAIAVGSGHPLIGSAFGIARNALKDWRAMRGAGDTAARAQALAPTLFDQNPNNGLYALNQVLQQQAARDAFNKQWSGAGGMFGGAAAPSLAYAYSQR